ncbi:MAG: cobalamin B12-binding domain-containing protein [Chloroflexi bacterium]|nr:cobalamin B12-binding domain-containing protein [Chloroflexota bacterium]
MLKVTLINPPQFTGYPQPPIGLALLAAVLEREGYQVTVLDANALQLRPENLASYIADTDVIGLTAVTPTIATALSIAHHLKQDNPDRTIILGGVHATLLPEETLAESTQIDIIVRGEGEETIIELLRALENKQPIGNIAGITYRKDGKIISTPARKALTDIDSLPFLAYHLLPWQRYRPHPPHGRALPFAALVTSRGCPYRCAYCSKPVFGSRFLAQSPERVVAEVSYIKERFGIKEIAFYDDVFTLNKKRTHAIADSLVQKNIKLFWTCEARVNLVDKELLRHIKQAGCYAIAYGIESASPEILKTLHKDITLEQVSEAISNSREAGLQTIGYFMLGSPGETPETIKQTIRFAIKLRLDFAQFSVTTPFPGTELYNLLETGKKNIPWQSFVYSTAGSQSTPVFENDRLTRNDLRPWTRRAYREFYLRPTYLWQRLRQIESWGDLKVNIKGLFMLLRSVT